MRRVAVPERGAEALFGTHDENLRFLESTLKVRIKSARRRAGGGGRRRTARRSPRRSSTSSGALMKDGYSVGAGRRAPGRPAAVSRTAAHACATT